MKSFLMLGQSNMAGRGDFGEVEEITNPLCKMLRNGRWQPMREPINPDRAIFGYYHSGVGLAASFADEYAKRFEEPVGLIPCADGGTSISEWQPGELLFDNAISNARLAQRTSEIVGILWHQGENDCVSLQNVAQYREKFNRTISGVITQLGLPASVPVVIGELGDFVDKWEGGRFRYVNELNPVLKSLAEESPSRAFVSVQGLTCKYDGIHFNSASYRELGKRYFKAYLGILGLEER